MLPLHVFFKTPLLCFCFCLPWYSQFNYRSSWLCFQCSANKWTYPVKSMDPGIFVVPQLKFCRCISKNACSQEMPTTWVVVWKSLTLRSSKFRVSEYMGWFKDRWGLVNEAEIWWNWNFWFGVWTRSRSRIGSLTLGFRFTQFRSRSVFPRMGRRGGGGYKTHFRSMGDN